LNIYHNINSIKLYHWAIEAIGRKRFELLKANSYQVYNLTPFTNKGIFLIFIPNYCEASQTKNFSKETDSITIGIELCKIPHISEHWP
jgi:hypothetical protein